MKKEQRYIIVSILTICLVLFLITTVSAQDDGLFNLRETGISGEFSEGTYFDLADDSQAADDVKSVDTDTQYADPLVGDDMMPIRDFPSKKDLESELISVNFENVDIRDVIQILADKGQVNMVVNPGVAATVNLQLNNVTWQKALEVILMTYNLTYKEDEGLIRIMTLDQMQKEDEKIPLETRIVKLNFARASTIKSNFENMLSPRGRIDVNARTNSLIVTDLPDFISDIEEIAIKLDTRTPQVMIEALLADVKVVTDDDLGINWEIKWPDTADNPQRTITQTVGGLSSLGAVFEFGTTMLTDKDLEATIAMWQAQDRVNILAHPQILTLDNMPAKIQLIEEIPYQQQTQTTEGGGVVSTSFKQAGIDLAVTPHITTKDNYVFLDINVSQSFQSATTPDGQPQVDRRTATTNLLVKDGETAVIGGLRKKSDTFSLSKVPFMGDIPFFGALFRMRTKDVTDTDLMIFVTPRIVEEFILTEKEEDRLGLFKEEDEDWIGKFDQIRGIKDKKAKRKVLPTPVERFYLRPPELTKDK